MTNAEAKLLLFDIAGRTESQRERDALAHAIGLVSEEAEDNLSLGVAVRLSIGECTFDDLFAIAELDSPEALESAYDIIAGIADELRRQG